MWQSLLRWETLKTAADRPQQERVTEGSAPGVTEQQDASLRAQRRGTLVEFLDEFERMSLKFPAHRGKNTVYDSTSTVHDSRHFCVPSTIPVILGTVHDSRHFRAPSTILVILGYRSPFESFWGTSMSPVGCRVHSTIPCRIQSP